MTDTIYKILENITNRTDIQEKPEHVELFAVDFNRAVLEPLRDGMKVLVRQARSELAPMSDNEEAFANETGPITLKRKAGFGVVDESNDCHEIYSLELDLESQSGLILSVNARVSYSTYGNGSDVDDIEVKINGETSALLENADDDGLLYDFIRENYQDRGFYDCDLKVVSDVDLAKIAAILGV